VKENEFVDISPVSTYLPGVKAVVMQSDTKTFFTSAEDSITVDPSNKYPKMVPWGVDNDLPQQIIKKVGENVFLSPNMLFNVLTGYGDGIMPVRRVSKNGSIYFEPYEGNAEVRTFFEENRTDVYLLEQLTDLNFFYNLFPEIIFNKENGDKRKIVQLTSKEAAFSRWSEVAKEGKDKGKLQYHYYHGDWKSSEFKFEDAVKTIALDRVAPVRHLRSIMEEDKDKSHDARRNRFIVPVSLPTPGKPYYSKPYWYALIESGVIDFAGKIMPFKNAMMDNMANIRYVVTLGVGYFEEIYKREKITTDKAKTTRQKQEYADIDKFLKSVKNTHKSIITHQKLDPTGKPYPMITITVLKNEMGGEFIADHEEVANIIAYGQSVHPSLVGASPGKSKTINGTEARELFALKQATMKPIRDLILYPFYLIKAINRWPEDLFFAIPNIELTTLDKNKSGTETVIPQNP
jgi:hypothetical protein